MSGSWDSLSLTALSGSEGPRALQPIEIMRSGEKGRNENMGCPVHSPGIRVTNTWRDTSHLVPLFSPSHGQDSDLSTLDSFYPIYPVP